jgi:tetratricopeptide (TPR) repeat protein
MQFPFRIATLLLVGVSVFNPIRAQDSDAAMKLRLAQSFEQAGEWEQAVALYEGLYRSSPANYVFFDGLRRGYTQLRAYDKAINLVERQLTLEKNDIGLLASLGGLFYESGAEQKADSVWNRVIQIDPKNIGLYRVVASQMMEHRLFDRAIDVYQKGRSATGNEDAFTDELATLYTVLQQYSAASTEFIKLLKATPQQLPFIENRIASFTIRGEGLRAATDVTQAELKKDPEDITLHKLFAWLSIEGKYYETALHEYILIDHLSQASGAELLGFAGRASQDKSYKVAADAFRSVIDLSRNPAILAQARLGYAQAMENASTQSDSSIVLNAAEPGSEAGVPSGRVSETEKNFQGVVRLYEAVIKDYPNSEYAAQSLYRIGIIRMQRFFDLNGALDAFRQAKNITHSPEVANDASLRSAEVFVARNDLVSARKEYQALARSPLAVYQQRAQFSIAELDYFEGNADTALAELKPLTANLHSDLTNDALMLQYFILENRTSNPAALRAYAKADLLMRQQKYSEAFAQFNEVVQTFPTTLLVDDATMKIGELLLLLDRPNDALVTFRHIVDDMPESILRDKAQMKIAETYQGVLKDKAKATAAYEQILSKFPNSLYLEEARKRIRQLRGDSI